MKIKNNCHCTKICSIFKTIAFTHRPKQPKIEKTTFPDTPLKHTQVRLSSQNNHFNGSWLSFSILDAQSTECRKAGRKYAAQSRLNASMLLFSHNRKLSYSFYCSKLIISYYEYRNISEDV